MDPLFEYEQELIQTQIQPSAPSFLGRVFRGFRLMTVYLLLSGTIFSALIGILNFSAYSARVLNWIDPSTLENIKSDLQAAISSSSMEVHASEVSISEEQQESMAVLTQKVAAVDPSVVYNRTYNADRLLGSMGEHSEKKATFDVTPYENRIIIPKIGKNIPLIDVNHGDDADYAALQDIFMEELKNGVVRYPGTARPGEVGNAFIFGHSSNYPWVKSQYNDVFALLDQLTKGDEITIFYDQKKYIYRVTDKSIVKPGDVKTLESRDPNKKELSIMTCWPIGTTLERIIVFSELVSEK